MMTNSKNTKRALLTSVLSMLLCVAMLVGSTFAWFTDSVTSGKNKIVAGNLDVELYHTNGAASEEKVEADTKLFVNSDGSDILWEPGVMVYENFTVKNVGSLALKYQLTVNADKFNTVAGTEKSLKDVLKVAILDEAFSGDRAAAQALTFDKTIADFAKEGNIEANAQGDTYAIVVYWEPSDIDNDYNLNNGKESSDGEPLFIDLGVNLVATQDTVENDSFDNQYDKDAGYPIGSVAREQELVKEGYVAVDNSDDLLAAISNSDAKVVLSKDITLDKSGFSGTNKLEGIIDANGKTILAKSENPKETYLCANIYGDGEIRNAVIKSEVLWGYYIDGTSFYNCTFDDCSPYFEPKNDLTIDGCSFVNNGNLQVVYLESHNTKPEEIKVNITNNTFDVPEGANSFGLSFITYGEAANVWAKEECSQYINVENNTFNPADGQDSYTAIWITDPAKKTILETAPSFSGNKYVGNAKLLLNQDKDKIFDLQ